MNGCMEHDGSGEFLEVPNSLLSDSIIVVSSYWGESATLAICIALNNPSVRAKHSIICMVVLDNDIALCCDCLECLLCFNGFFRSCRLLEVYIAVT